MTLFLLLLQKLHYFVTMYVFMWPSFIFTIYEEYKVLHFLQGKSSFNFRDNHCECFYASIPVISFPVGKAQDKCCRCQLPRALMEGIGRHTSMHVCTLCPPKPLKETNAI